MDATFGRSDCCYDLYTLTRAFAELALGSNDRQRIVALRARASLRSGATQVIGMLAIGDAENGIVQRSKIHVCRMCRMYTASAAIVPTSSRTEEVCTHGREL
jgi:hypothetical protein